MRYPALPSPVSSWAFKGILHTIGFLRRRPIAPFLQQLVQQGGRVTAPTFRTFCRWWCWCRRICERHRQGLAGAVAAHVAVTDDESPELAPISCWESQVRGPGELALGLVSHHTITTNLNAIVIPGVKSQTKRVDKLQATFLLE
jgi:hypothetical protein